MPHYLNGEVSLVALADLSGLGATTGRLVNWTVPADLVQEPPFRPGANPSGPRPSTAVEKRGTSWKPFAGLLLAAIWLVSRRRSGR